MKRILLGFLLLFFLFLPTVFSQSGPVRFGVVFFYPPFVFTDGMGHPYGFDIAVAKAICKQMDAECIFNSMPLSDLIMSLQRNNVDAIISAISITPDRKQLFDFSQPYFKSTMSYVGSSDSDLQLDQNGIAGKKIGVLAASTFSNYLKTRYGNIIKIQEYFTSQNAINDLTNGKIDLVLLDTPNAKYWVAHSSNMLKRIGEPLDLPGDEGFGIAVRKGNTDLLNAINNALNVLNSNGTLNQIIQTYFSLGG